mgnify:CR=1 FL=1
MKVATIILNRNLPEITNNLYEHIKFYDGEISDIFVVEAGSDNTKLSKYCTWHVNDEETIKNGLRYSRGMNFALSELVKTDKFENYDYYFLITNDTELDNCKTIENLLNIMKSHDRLGILSPCSKNWGEKYFLKDQATKYFWFIHNTAYFISRKCISDICTLKNPDLMNFLFDGTNFRGFGSEHELIAKGYANNWASAITSSVWANENESHLITKADKIKTESYDENKSLYIEEGRNWMRNKYGFNSHWAMQNYVKMFYESFFKNHPEYIKYKL